LLSLKGQIRLARTGTKKGRTVFVRPFLFNQATDP
jgi:hypothetical protein